MGEANAVVSRFVTATRVNVPDYMIRGGQTYRILTDHLGSPRLVVDTASGLVSQRRDQDEWGVLLEDTSSGLQPHGFAGGLLGSREISLGARDYLSESGRWARKDPIMFYGRDQNLYAYSGLDPVNLYDPSGLSACIALYPGARGLGHVVVGVGGADTFGLYPAGEGIDVLFGDVPGVVKPDRKFPPEDVFCFDTTAEQERALQKFFDSAKSSPPDYNLYGNNCSDFVRDALERVGVEVPPLFFPGAVYSWAVLTGTQAQP